MSSTTTYGHLTTFVGIHMVYVYIVGRFAPAMLQRSAAAVDSCLEIKLPGVCLTHLHLNSFVTKSSALIILTPPPDFLYLHENYFRFKTIDSGGITTLNRRNHGFTGLGVDLTSSFLKILYIFFCAIHFLMFCLLFIVFFFCFLFLNLLRGVHRENNEGHSKRSNCRKKITIMFCPLITIEGACDCVWVCVSECLCAYIKV